MNLNDLQGEMKIPTNFWYIVLFVAYLIGMSFVAGMDFCAECCKPYIPKPIYYFYDPRTNIYDLPIGKHP